jgi:hypothetical protein
MHPSHMTDTELNDLLNIIQKNTRLIDFNPQQNQVLVEYIKRQEFIKGDN